MDNIKESVTISLERYEELMDIKKKYESDNRYELEIECKNLRISNKEHLCDKNWMSRKFNSEVKFSVLHTIRDIISDIISNINCFGFISKNAIQKITDNFLKEYESKDVLVWEGFPNEKKYEFPISKNVTDNVSNQDFITLQKEMDFLVYKFMRTHDIPNGERINYNIDALQHLKEDGVENPWSDRYLAIVDDSNNTLIESV